MSDQQSAPTASPTETNGAGVIPDFESRSAAVFEDNGAGDGGDPAALGAPSPVAPGPTDPARAARIAKRQEEYKRLQEEERGRVDAMAAMRERDQLRAKLAEVEPKLAQSSSLIDPSKLDPEAFMSLAEKVFGDDPKKLADWITARTKNPELVAVSAARRAVDPEIAQLKEIIANQGKQLENFIGSQAKAQADASESVAHQQFNGYVAENSATSPLAASFLKTYGPEEFAAITQAVLDNVHPSGGPQAILDEVEELLSRRRQQLAQWMNPAETAAPQRTQATPNSPNPPQRQAPTHVSNSLAQQRSSVVSEEAAWAQLPFEERSARLFNS